MRALLLVLLVTFGFADSASIFEGSWVFNISNATDSLPVFDSVNLGISTQGTSSFCTSFLWGPGTADAQTSSISFSLDGSNVSNVVDSRVFHSNAFTGLEVLNGSVFYAQGSSFESSLGVSWVVTHSLIVLGSQGRRTVTVHHNFTVTHADPDVLLYVQTRSSRSRPVQWVFIRSKVASLPDKGRIMAERKVSSPSPAIIDSGEYAAAADALWRSVQAKLWQSAEAMQALSAAQHFVMNVSDDWNMNSGADGLQQKALLLSLQGLVNRAGPTLFFDYPDDWVFTYSGMLREFYSKQHNMSFMQLTSTSDALKHLTPLLPGAHRYVVFDTDVPNSLSVAFTLAGLESAVVVGGDLVPTLEAAGYTLLRDFRGFFANQTDAQVISWAYEEYGERTNKSFVMWLGGECGPAYHPAVADFGVMSGAFFAGDLSTKPTDEVEYMLASKIVSNLDPLAVMVGWHSYCKDEEHDMTTLMSKYGHRVHGLNTLPDLSFNFHVPLSRGFVFHNHHSSVAKQQQTSTNESDVLVACVQSDGLGLGAWNKPGRGEIPYTWECTINDLWMQPAMLEMFYRQATDNDYFVGALSGPGYMYPKAVPPKLLPVLLSLAQKFMEVLDLNAFDLMDESQGTTVVGNMNLYKEQVDAYMEFMPKSIGFVNGYAPSFTFASNGSRAFLSFDYYLSPDRSDDEVIADLQELAAVNIVRPYYMVIHVREWNNILRVEQILAALKDFKLIGLEPLLMAAGSRPTFVTRFEDDPQ